MIKYSGLGRLADVHKELTDPAGRHYPVRRRGERRKLRPNWTGIAWLEAQARKATELLSPLPVYASGDEPVWYTWPAARLVDRITDGVPSHCVRPMIALIDDYHVREEQMSGQSTSHQPCPDCDDWSRTARCAEHTERGTAAVTDAGLIRGRSERLTPRPEPEPPSFGADSDGVLYAGPAPESGRAFREFLRGEPGRLYAETGIAHIDYRTLRRISDL